MVTSKIIKHNKLIKKYIELKKLKNMKISNDMLIDAMILQNNE